MQQLSPLYFEEEIASVSQIGRDQEFRNVVLEVLALDDQSNARDYRAVAMSLLWRCLLRLFKS
jgi:hypothetical protein